MSPQKQRTVMTPALLFGVVFDLLLFGILTAQVYIYYISFPKDRVLLKVAVSTVYLAGVAQTGLALVDVWMSFTKWLEYLRTLRFKPYSDHLWLSITISTAGVAIIIQFLYANRIYVISQKRWLAIMVMCMSLVQLGSGIFGAICYHKAQAVSTMFRDPGFMSLGESAACHVAFTWTWGPLNILCDLTITSCMVTFLLKRRKTTMRGRTRSHITNIIRIVVETGMATTILMIVYTSLFVLWMGNIFLFTRPFHPLPGLMMSKVYSNSMLGLLNNRVVIKDGRNTVETFEFIEHSSRDREGDSELRTRTWGSTASGEALNDAR